MPPGYLHVVEVKIPHPAAVERNSLIYYFGYYLPELRRLKIRISIAKDFFAFSSFKNSSFQLRLASSHLEICQLKIRCFDHYWFLHVFIT